MKKNYFPIYTILLTFLLFLPTLSTGEEISDLSLAKKLMSEGLYELAYDEFFEFAEKNRNSPDAPEAFYLAYDCLFLQGEYAEASSQFSKYIRDFPFSPFTPFAQERIGEVYLKLKDYEKAKETFEGFIKLYPENEKTEDALFWLGESYYNMREYKKARYYYNLCMERYPKGRFYDYALFSLGFSYRQEKRFDDAEKFFKTLIGSHPHSSLVEDAYISIGEIEFEKGELDSSLTAFTNYRKNYPKGTFYDKSLLYTGRVYTKKREEKLAIKAYGNLIKNFPDSRYTNPARYYIAWIYFERKNYEHALKHFRTVERTSKLYFPSLYWSSVILERQGKREDAVQQFKELSVMKDAGGFRNDALYELARISYESKDTLVADSLVQVLERTDRKWKALLLKGNCLFEKERYLEAIEIYSQIIREEKNGIRKDAIYRLASSLYNTKDYRKAEEYFNVYLTNYPDGEYRKEAMLLFAECAFKMKKWKDALARYRNVKATFPNTQEARLAMMGEGWTLSKLGRDKEAYAILKKVKGVEGEKKDWLTLGDAAYNAGRFNEAISNYKKASKEKATREIGLFKLGNTYYRIKKQRDAIKTYDELIEKFPMGDLADDAYFKKGEALRKLGDYKSSSITMESLRKLYPSSDFIGRSHTLSGDNYFDTGDFDNARIQYQKMIEMLKLPRDTVAVVPIHGIMKSIQRKDGEKRAIEYADIYIDRFKGTYLSERIRMLKADMFYYSGKIKEAEEEYGAVENKRLKPVALYYQARSLQLLKKNNEAEKRLREIIDEFPRSRMVSKAVLLLGKVLFEGRKYSESLKFLEKTGKPETEEDFEVVYIKGEVYLKLNYKKKAIETFKEIKDTGHGKWKGKALLRLGDIMLDDEKLTEAFSFYEKAEKTGESEIIPEAYYMKGKVLEKQGNDKEALKTFLKIKYNLPDSPFTTKALFEAAEIALRTGKKQDALSLYKEVIERNDDKTLTIRAKDRLKTINP
ncbi:MAG: tetratricopeptide repeat protein [Candidatus Cloacimonadota bacterium]|nr:MAG: tetratricopeptide repeat protein [Candidatus Cloacimonadota bacterium]